MSLQLLVLSLSRSDDNSDASLDDMRNREREVRNRLADVRRARRDLESGGLRGMDMTKANDLVKQERDLVSELANIENARMRLRAARRGDTIEPSRTPRRLLRPEHEAKKREQKAAAYAEIRKRRERLNITVAVIGVVIAGSLISANFRTILRFLGLSRPEKKFVD